MLTYNFENRKRKSLYEFLYESIRDDILSGRLLTGARLPSKREMARDNGISVKTVINAYEQLLMEGYIDSEEKKGYFVANVHALPEFHPVREVHPAIYQETEWLVDFTANTTVYDKFPFSTWKKTLREVLSQYDTELIQRGHYLGAEILRQEIADYLYRARGMTVSRECIVIGAGIEYLYERLIRLLNPDCVFAVENPGYKKIPRIYENLGLRWKWVEMDEKGIRMDSLRAGQADVIHVSPEHHFPLGTVMSTARRQELLSWACEQEGRYIIEDDYDCEFRYHSRSIPSLQSMDRQDRVIYMNTFSKTMTPAIRISYMVLPRNLMELYVKNTNFYTNSASSLEQYALAHFIRNGCFERHLSRMKKFYRLEGERLIRILRQSSILPVKSIAGGDSGTHLLLALDTSMTDQEIKEAAREQGINLSCLSDYCSAESHGYENILVLNYSELDEATLQTAVQRLANIFIQW